MATHAALRACSLRSAPFQRGPHQTTSIGAGPGPGSSNASPCPCAAPPAAPRSVATGASLDRRDMMLLSSSLVMSHLALLGGCTPPAHAARGLDRYIRRKSLDPLETYVPLVLEARALLAKAKDLAAQDVGAARELLRAGPYNGLRDNIRAIGEYAARDGRTTEVGPLVTGFFKALEGYDQLLLNALRDKTPVEADKLDACIADLYAAFDKLIATVPADILEQAQRVLDVTMAKAAVRQEEPAGGAEGGAEGGQGGAGAVVVDQEAAELLQLLR